MTKQKTFGDVNRANEANPSSDEISLNSQDYCSYTWCLVSTWVIWDLNIKAGGIEENVFIILRIPNSES